MLLLQAKSGQSLVPRENSHLLTKEPEDSGYEIVRGSYSNTDKKFI